MEIFWKMKTVRRIILWAAVLLLLCAASIGAWALTEDAPELQIKYCNVSYGNSVHFWLSVNATNIPEGAEVGLTVRKGSPDATPAEAVLKQRNFLSSGEQLIFRFDGLALSEMTVELYATPYVRLASGEMLYGEMKKTSVLEYSYRVFGKIGTNGVSDEETKEMISAMLDFGAASQTYSDKNVDRLANADYYFVRTVDGVIVSDGFTKGLYKEGDTVPLAANEREDKSFIGWCDSKGATVSEHPTFVLIVGNRNETYVVKYGGLTRSIAYEPNGGTLPEEYATSYVEGEVVSLPEPTKEGYAFGGWYTSEGLERESSLGRIGESTRGDLKLYAKWCGVISSLDGDDMLAKGNQTLNSSSDIGEFKNGFTAEDGALIWNQGDSIRSQISLSGNIAKKLNGETVISLSVTLARDEAIGVQPASLRLRRANDSGESGQRIIIPLSLDTSGNVLLGEETGYCITSLTSEFQTVRIAVDFEKCTYTAYDELGLAMMSCDFALPSADAGKMTATEWMSKLTGVLWQFYSAERAGGGQLKVKNISLFAGNVFARIMLDELTEEERAERLSKIVSLVEEQRNRIRKGHVFGDSTKDINAVEAKYQNKWGTPGGYPIAEHPRLFLTADSLDEIHDSIERMDENTKLRFRTLLGSAPANACRLPEPEFKGTNSTVDLDNIHNFDASCLELIQAKALGYLLYGDEYHGYQAIYYLKNFIETLDIVQIASDQCRQYGSVMTTAAMVYDWCYDLLTEEDKEQIIAAVENRICRYKNQAGAAMEVGFPPYGQGSVSGHGSERQILRDYLAFATAIYGDNDSWWNYVAARVYNDYVPVRNYYFSAGIPHQGTNYAAGRHISDLFSDWIITVATGKSPYNDYIKTTVRGLLGLEVARGLIFNDGDGTGDTKATSDYMHIAFISAYLYNDGYLLAEARDMLGSKIFSSDHNYLTSVMYLTLAGLSDVSPVEDVYAEKELIQYNGYPLGQYVIREAWADECSAAVMMRLKERSTANHEHCDTGTFEIYYKGMLTSDGGCYNNYGHVHTQYFHQATISHNGLIIYNPSLASTDGGWYSGGQEKLGGESQNLEILLSNTRLDTADLTGRQHGYADGDESEALYAYIAGELTEAYADVTVDYVGRRMLTVYTKNPDFPMVFFVYDDITSDEASYEKRFLLQISSKNEPIVSGNTVTTENGEGRLVLTSLSDSIRIDKQGGVVYDANGRYSAKLSSNYLINGKQLCPKSDTANDGHWGRIEIVWTKNTKNASFMNVIYVTDKGQTKAAPAITEIVGTGVTGGVFGDVAAIFATSRDRATGTLSATVSGTGNMNYYVSGVAAGEWTVKVGGVSYGTATATEEGGLLTFTAPAGALTLTKK